ncbi:unnamed protein product [Peniophora sp. CBMAI 1063]|nr:unnamed protein product [Peniophora sp. CBMAI 1063]
MATDAEDSAPVFWRATRKARSLRCGQTRDAWAREVAAMTEELAYANAQLNTFAPINALPDEVLARVFELLAPLDPIMARNHTWGWVSVTHACRRFRAVAHNHATLWSELSVDGNTPWNLFLPKSRRTLLTIRGEPDWDRRISARYYPTCTMQNIDRLQHLDIQEFDFADPACTLWLNVLSTVAPELLSLKLEVDDLAEPPRDGSLVQWPTVSPHFLSRDAPKLREFNMSGIRMTWKLDNPIMLRSLLLEWRDATLPTSQSLSEVLDCLSNLPLLEELVLWAVLPEATVDSAGRHIVLSHLRLLFLEDHSGPCLALWASIQAPSQCSIRIRLVTTDDAGQAMLRSLIKQHLARPDCPVYQRLQVGDSERDRSSDHSTQFSLHTAVSTDEANNVASKLVRRHSATYTIDATPMLAFNTIPHQVVPNHATAFLGILDLFPSQPIRTLRLTQWLPVTAGHPNLIAFVTSLLSQLPALETIEVRDVDGRSSNTRFSLGQAFCLGFLQNHTSRSTAENVDADFPGCYLPQLHTLSLEQIYLEFQPSDDDWATLFAVLTEALEHRIRAHAPLHTLKLSRMYLQDGWREQLGALVSHIEERDAVDARGFLIRQ